MKLIKYKKGKKKKIKKDKREEEKTFISKKINEIFPSR